MTYVNAVACVDLHQATKAPYVGQFLATFLDHPQRQNIASVSAVQQHVWSWGKTGSSPTTVKMALMTRNERWFFRHSSRIAELDSKTWSDFEYSP